jgi:hypothetical protein
VADEGFVPVLRVVLDVHGGDPAEALADVAAEGERGTLATQELLHHPGHDVVEQLVLRPDVLVEARRPHAHGLAEIRHRRCPVADRGEELERGRPDLAETVLRRGGPAGGGGRDVWTTSGRFRASGHRRAPYRQRPAPANNR